MKSTIARFIVGVASILFAVQTPSWSQKYSEMPSRPAVRLIIQPAPDNLDEIRGVVTAFANENGLSIYEGKLPSLSGKPDFLSMTLQRLPLTIIVMNGGRENRVFVFFYQSHTDETFWKTESKLEASLSSHWPRLAPYTGP